MTPIVASRSLPASPPDRANVHLCPHDRKRASTACAASVRRLSFRLRQSLPPRLACPSSVRAALPVGPLPHTHT